MSDGDRLDRRLDWTRRGSLVILAVILAITAWTLPKVVQVERSQADERELLRDQNALLLAQNDDLAALIARQQEVDEGRDARLQGAVDGVEALLVDYFALHDQNTARKLNELLQRIAVLLDRPPPEPIQPSTASAREPDPPPSTTTRPPSTTTTSPGRSDLCEHNPNAFPCRR